MHARVTAVLVSSNGAEHLPRTLEALAAQTRAPDAVVVVDCASTDGTGPLLAAAKPTGYISASSRLSFGTAVTHALGVAPPPASENEWLWLLAHDTAPEPDALAALLAAVEVNPSVAAAGPKQMEWNDPDYISEFGETITRLGASVPLVETELDQAQHDRLSDVLAMGAAGLLVRHTVWNEVGGFDPALPTADNALDFSIRVRLAGHRVLAVPAARVATDGDGFSGPGRSIKGSARRRRQTARRAAQLHRRLVYAPPFAVVFHWLSLVPLAVARSLFQLVRKQPGAIGGEFAAAFKTAFGSKIGESRSRLKAARKVGWKAIAPLRMPGDEIRRRRSLQREIALTYLRGERDRIQFIASGGVATVLVVALIGFVVFLPVFGAAAITGGGALPLETTVGGLWAQIGTGFRDIGLGFVGAADPFAAVLAVLGSITFWSPSFAIVCLYLVALPLAALAAWFCAAHLTRRPLLRTVAAVLWVLAPPFLGALDSGMIGPVLAHLLLPWLILAILSAPKSWSASAMASILFAAVLAAAPSLWPALIVIWLIATVASRRNVARLIGLPIPALVLFGPLAWNQFQRGTPLAILADPGLPVWRPSLPIVDLLMGLPQTGIAGWESVGATFGIDSGVVLLVVGLLAVPLGLLALASLFLPGSYRAVFAVIVGILGFVTAVAATQLAIATSGSQAVSIWPGSGLSLYWMGLVGAAVLGLGALPRFAGAPALVATVAIGVIALPLSLGVLLGTAEVVPGSGRALPAYVTAEASNTPRVGTAVLEPQQSGGLAASVVHGAGPTLNQQSTLASTAAFSAVDDEKRTELAAIVGNASSISGADVATRLTALGVEFVLLEPVSPAQAGIAADGISARAANALNSNPQLTFIGSTFAGDLWQVSSDGSLATLPEPVPTNTGTPLGVLVLVIQGFVFGVALLLALPAGRLQVQGNRAVSTTAHVGAADSVEEEIAEEKHSEFDDDVAVGEEPEALEVVEEPDVVDTAVVVNAEPESVGAGAGSRAFGTTSAMSSAGTAGAGAGVTTGAGLMAGAVAAGVLDRDRDSTTATDAATTSTTTDSVTTSVADDRAAAHTTVDSVTTPATDDSAATHSAPVPIRDTDRPADVPAGSAPVQAPTDSAPVQAPAGSAPVQAPTDSAPVQGPADSAPVQAPADSAPVQAPADSAPGQAPADSAPVQAPADSAPVQAPTSPAGGGEPAPETPIVADASTEPAGVDPFTETEIVPPAPADATAAPDGPAPAGGDVFPPAEAAAPFGDTAGLESPGVDPLTETEIPATEAPESTGPTTTTTAPDADDYDPNDETVLSVRDALDRTELDRTEQDRTEQDRTELDRTEEGRTDGR